MSMTVYEIVNRAGIQLVAGLDSPGAGFVVRVRDDYAEALTNYGPDEMDRALSVSVFSLETIPNHEQWRVFADLAGWLFEDEVRDSALPVERADLTRDVALRILRHMYELAWGVLVAQSARLDDPHGVREEAERHYYNSGPGTGTTLG